MRPSPIAPLLPPETEAARRSLASSLITERPLEEVIRLTQGWPVGEAGELLGVVRVALEDHGLPRDTPGLGLFRALLPEDAPALFDAASPGGRLDQRCWPVYRDAELAWWAASRITDLHEPCLSAVQRMGRCINGEDEPSALRSLRTELEPVHWGTQFAHAGGGPRPSEAEALTLFQHLAYDKEERAQEEFLRAFRRPFVYEQDLFIAYTCCQTAVMSLDGWMSYHAHRRLPSLVATSAGHTVGTAAKRIGAGFWPEFLVRALYCLLP